MNITARKSADEAAHGMEQKYGDIFEHALEGIFQTSPAGSFVVANPALARMFGFDSAEELLRERADVSKQHYVDPTRRDEFMRLLEKEGIVHHFEYEAYRKDGSRIWASDTVRAVRDESGKLLGYEGIAKDITERKRLERTQRESQQQYETLVQSIDGIVWEADPRTFTFTFVSKQAERILGYPLAKWFEGPGFWTDHMHPEDRDRTIAFCVDATARKKDHQFEYRMIAADGHVVWLSDIVTVHVSADQSVLLRGVMVDITERKRVEEKLRQSESQLAEAQCLASVGSWNWDLRNNALTWSDELHRMYGLHPQESEPSYEKFLELVHPDDRSVISGAIEHALKTQGPINSYLRIIRPDRAERIIHSRGNTISDISGIPIRMHGTVQDVTERKQAEDALHEAERKYRSIFENAGEGIFQSTPDGRYIAANPTLARMHGFASPDDLIHSCRDISRQIYVDPTCREEFKRQIEDKGAVRGLEHQVFRRDGGKIWISVNARAVRDEQGGIKYYEGTAQDITDRKRAEEALRESEERYRDLVENSLDLICTHDLDGFLLSANRAAMEIMGYSSDSDAVGKNLRELLAPEVSDQFDDYLKRIRANGAANGLMLMQTRTGERRIWEYHNTLRTQGVSAPTVRGMARDITEQRQANQSLRLFRALIDRSSDAIEVVDPDTLRFLDCNRSAYQDLGYSREEFLTLSVYDIDPLADERMLARLNEELDRSGFVIFESIHRRKDGSTFPVEINLKLVRLERTYRLAAVRDITERKLAEEALGQAEQKYQRIFENASEGIFQSTPDGSLIAANPALARMYGFASSEELIRSRQDISRQLYVDPTRREEFKRQLEQRDSIVGFEHQVFRKDGSRIWVSANAHTVRDAQGEIQYYEGTAQDITDRKRTEDELIKQKELLQKIVDHIPVMINFCDSDGRVKLVNRVWQQTLGWSLEETLQEDVDVFAECYPDPQVRQDVLDFLTAATGDWADFRTRTRDGRMIDTSWVRVKLSDGTTMGIGQDITARKRAEQALRQAEQKYRELFENAKDAIYVHDLSGKYTSINRAAEQLGGYSREEVLGKHFSSLVAPEYIEHVRQNLCRKLRDEGETSYEIEVITKDGRRVPVEISSCLIYEEGVPIGVQGTARNIAERKRAEEALRGYSRQLIQAQEAERQHIARELHDQIGQVLTAVRINLQTIGNSCESAESGPLIEQGVGIIDAALELVRSLSFELRPSLLDNLGLVAALRWYCDQYTQRTGIQTRSATNLPEDQIRLRQELETACFRIVQEALTNVVRHANAKNVSIDLSRLDRKIVLSIKDDGIGFVELSPNGGASASRLGLRGMKERALALGGTIQIESAPGQGTEIRACFPNESKGD